MKVIDEFLDDMFVLRLALERGNRADLCEQKLLDIETGYTK